MRPFRRVHALLLVALAALPAAAGCYPLEEPVPPPLGGPAVQLLSPTATLVGDGYQYGQTGTATHNTIRDGGQTAVMPDGYTLQVYSDTMAAADVKPFYFQTNSAALSAPGDSQSLEYELDARPVPLLPWTPEEAAGVVNGVRYVGVWPTGATWVPGDVSGGNRVLITYQRVFTDLSTTPITFRVLGQGVAEYRYPGAQRALELGIQGNRINDDLFPGDNNTVMASPVYANGWVYMYGCNGSVSCTSARVRPDQVADASAWMWWDGSDYTASREHRQPIGVAEFSVPHVQWMPQYLAYAFVNSRGGDDLVVRWSASPAGPWTDPQLVKLPVCGPTMYQGGCYAMFLRPESTANSMVMSYASYGENRTRLAAVPVRLPWG